jgi:hypothetical protein
VDKHIRNIPLSRRLRPRFAEEKEMLLPACIKYVLFSAQGATVKIAASLCKSKNQSLDRRCPRLLIAGGARLHWFPGTKFSRELTGVNLTGNS